MGGISLCFCPYCSNKLIKRGWQKRKIYDYEQDETIISKNYFIQRYCCVDCHKYFTLTPYEWIAGKRYPLQMIEDMLIINSDKSSDYDIRQIMRIESSLSLQTSFKTEGGKVTAESFFKIKHESVENKIIIEDFLEGLSDSQKFVAFGYMNKLEECDIAELLHISLLAVEKINKEIGVKWTSYEEAAKIH